MGAPIGNKNAAGKRKYTKPKATKTSMKKILEKKYGKSYARHFRFK